VPAERTSAPRGHWKDKENQKAFLDQLAIKLNIQKPEDWYKVTSQLVLEKGGSFLAKYYNYSLIRGNNTTLLLYLPKKLFKPLIHLMTGKQLSNLQ
jgi:hypothetical protein